jgi:hypothetical protein
MRADYVLLLDSHLIGCFDFDKVTLPRPAWSEG